MSKNKLLGILEASEPIIKNYQIHKKTNSSINKICRAIRSLSEPKTKMLLLVKYLEA